MQECSMPISASFSLHNHSPEMLLVAQSSHRAELVYQGSWYTEEGAEGWKRARAGTAQLFYGGRCKGNILMDEEKRGKCLPRKLLYSTTFPFPHHTSPDGTEVEKKSDNETGKHFLISEPEDLFGSSPPGLRAMPLRSTLPAGFVVRARELKLFHSFS